MEKYKRKRVAEEKERLEEAYEEFRETFEDGVVKTTKAFIRGDIVNPDKSVSTTFTTTSSVYKPAPVIQIKNSLEVAKRIAQETAKKIMSVTENNLQKDKPQQSIQAQDVTPIRPSKPTATKIEKSRLTNLEAFKEELKQIQAIRDEKKGLRQHLKEKGVSEEEVNRIIPTLDSPYLGPGISLNVDYENDPTTTNLYVCNLPSDAKLEDFFETFGSFGPLASAKVLFPKPDEERFRNTLSGFVAFMSRVDAERSMYALHGEVYRGCELRVSWARPVVIPPLPFYVPPPLRELAMPDPPSGLPFNAKPQTEELRIFLKKYHDLPKLSAPLDTNDVELCEDYKKMIENSTVRVVVPTERPLLHLIHRVVEFLVRSGPLFEAILMAKERQNPMYRFLFDNHHPTHVYYRWRLYSILQGDDRVKWRLDKFKMFEGGSWWSPPPHALFELGMPPQLYNTAYVTKKRRSSDKKQVNLRLSTEKKLGEEREEIEGNIKRVERRKRALKNIAEKEEERKRLKGVLNDQSREELEDILRNLTPEKIVIGDAMIWCLDHAECSKEITHCIFESLCIKETPLHKKIARIYLVSDILANCAARVKDAFYYRQHFGDYLLKIFSELNETLDSIESRLKAEQFRQRVMICFRNWEDHAVYPTQDLIKWQNIFLGLLKTDAEIYASIDGDPLLQGGEDEDLDGLPIQEEGDDDIDGMPMVDDDGESGGGDLDGIPIINDDGENDRFTTGSWSTLEPVDQLPGNFQPAPSKWESVEISRWEKQNLSTDNKNNSSMLKAFESENGNLNDDLADTKRRKLSKLSPSPERESKKIVEISTSNDEEERRKMLREIEMRVMKLQDKLEADGKTTQADIDEQVTKLRQDLVQRMEEKLGMLRHRHSPTHSEVRKNRRENSPNRPREGRQHRRERSRSPIRTSRHRHSPSRSRHRERSPIRSSRRH